MQETKKLDDLLEQEISYDGDEYSRDGIQTMVEDYQEKHGKQLNELEQLRSVHDEIASEMNKDLLESKSAWEYLRSMMTTDTKRFQSSFKGLLEHIPVLREYVPDRPVTELLQDKILVSEKRTKEMGSFLDKVESEIQNLRNDITRLNKKMIIAAHNEEKAAKYILDLKDYKLNLEKEMEEIKDEKNAEYREKSAMVDEIKKKIWEHGGRLRIYSNAEDRIVNIIKMNNNFLEILTNLHTNITILFEAGSEVLDDLRGNLTGLATVTEASEVTLKMQESMESLKESVNKIASLASNTSLYLTQNVERMTSEMKVYDDETQKLIQDNLSREREIKEQRVDETIELAIKEYGLIKEARKTDKEETDSE
ncbi:MAG: hypothetical protein K8T10_01490 [Candidatus Eremiobacteraeota bacterium]|nr:hypothetical protein [Candidatus Eremiobacteraeota bacterium]